MRNLRCSLSKSARPGVKHCHLRREYTRDEGFITLWCLRKPRLMQAYATLLFGLNRSGFAGDASVGSPRSLFGRSTWYRRYTLLLGQCRDVSGFVVMTFLPRTTPLIPRPRISRSTGHLAASSHCRRKACQILRTPQSLRWHPRPRRDGHQSLRKTIRPITLNRNNALVAGHDAGCRSWARMASQIDTCKMTGIDPQAHLRATIETVTNSHPKSQIDDLMVWAFAKTPTR